MGRFKNKLFAKLFTKFTGLAENAAKKIEPVAEGGAVPWAPFTKSLKAATVAIVTTAGVHLKSQTPFDMDCKDGDASFREIPSGAPLLDYTITHDYYDHSDADKDVNIVFPVDRLKEMAAQGVIGVLAKFNYGFMGHITGGRVEELIKKSGPEVARRLKNEGVDIVIMTPG
jgi:D-proline reductase (dithiol) PrdB